MDILVQFSAEVFESVNVVPSEQADGEGGFVVVERFIEIGGLSAQLAVGSAGDRGKISQHDADSQRVGKMHGLLDLLQVALGMTEQFIGRNISSGYAGFF